MTDESKNVLQRGLENIHDPFSNFIRLCYPNYQLKKIDLICFETNQNNTYSDEQVISIIQNLYLPDVSFELIEKTTRSLTVIGVYKVPPLPDFNVRYHTRSTSETHIVITHSWVSNNHILIKELFNDTKN
jgi:hypothetical protein